MQWNKFILTGYRLNYVTWRQILGSLFQWHNETINIWTHLIGLLSLFVLLLVISISQIGEEINNNDTEETQVTMQHALSEFFSAKDTSWDFGLIKSQTNELTLVLSTLEQSYYAEEISDGSYMPRFHTGFAHSEEVSKWPIVAYLITALFCLGCSTICHWFYDKDPNNLGRIVATLDYWGIVILINGTSYPFISYRYACGYLIVYRYVFVVILSVLTLVLMVVTMYPTFLKPIPKAILFSSFGLFCLVPAITLYVIDDHENGLKPGLDPFTWSTMFYAIGLTFFVTKFPERQSKTGRFDILFSSHQIHHICVLFGVTIAFLESFEVYQKRLNFTCPSDEAIPV